MITNADAMTEIITMRVPAGAGRLLTDDARRLGLSRSELLRRAALAFIDNHRDGSFPDHGK
jgi:hypothetical protein